jgi:hypothetical protein
MGADTNAVMNEKINLATIFCKRNNRTSESEIRDMSSRIGKQWR